MDETLNKEDIRIIQEKRWFGFQFLVIFIVLTLGIGASGYFYYKSQEKQLREATNDQLSAVADLKVKQIVAWRNDRIEDATLIMKQSSFVPFVHQWLENPADSNLEEKVSAWMRVFQEEQNFEAVFLADSQGNTRLSLPQRGTQLSACIQSHFTEALRTRKIFFTDFHFVATTHRIHLALIIPLFDSNTAPFGFMVLEIDPYQFLYPLIQTWPTPSKTAETLLVRREGNEVVFLNELRHLKNTALTLRVPISQKKLPSAMVMRGELGEVEITEGIDYRGVPVLATIRKIPDSPWFLVAKIDLDEARALLKRRTQFVAIIVVLLIALSGVGFGLLWRHQRAQFYKKQYETERKLATERKRAEEIMRESEKKYRALIETTNTGYVILDLAGTVLDANDEYVRLTGHEHRDEILGRSIVEWTAAYDRERNEKAVEACVRQGFLRNLEIDYVGPRGQTIPIEGNGTLVTTSNETHIIALCHDISERKKTKDALQESEKKYRTLFELSSDAIMMLDKDRFFDGNQATLDLFGFTSKADFITKSPADLSPPTQADGTDSLTAQKRHLATTLETGTDFFEWVHKKADGTIFPAEVKLSRLPLREQVVLQALVRDITERKQAEEEREKLILELRTSLEKVKTLSGLLPICAACKKIRDDKGYWNQIDSYIRDHSEAEFTHGICPECMKKLYPDFEIVE